LGRSGIELNYFCKIPAASTLKSSPCNGVDLGAEMVPGQQYCTEEKFFKEISIE